jgi:putative membrane protein
MLQRFLLRWVINGLALWAAASIVPGFHYEGWTAIAIVALIFGLVNALIRPIVLVATCLVNLVTLGLFTLIVNAAMLALTSWIVGQLGIPFQITGGFLTVFLGALVVSIVSFVLTKLAE